MNEETLIACLDYAKRNALSIHLICGPGGSVPSVVHDLPEGSCIYTPVDAPAVSIDTVLVADENQVTSELARRVDGRTIILRGTPRGWLAAWRLLSSASRVTLLLSGLDGYSLDDLSAHAAAVESARIDLEEYLVDGKRHELNVLTDRLALDAPMECGAGISHLTADIDGKLYICPAFALDEGAGAIGDIFTGPDKLSPLLARACAPICEICDAFHCRRCVALNRRVTGELNTPPWQVCRVAHIERAASRALLRRLQLRGAFLHCNPIEEIPYQDPLELLIYEPAGERTCERPGYSLPHPRGGCLGAVSEAEARALRQIDQRLAALRDLTVALSKLTHAELDDSALYDRLLRDTEDALAAKEEWWLEVCHRYGWIVDGSVVWRIDWSSRLVYVQPASHGDAIN